jgi:hypothetical protein
MKTLLIILAIALSSCEVCEECTTTTYQNGVSTPLATSTTEVCGRKEIKQIEGTTTATSGSVTVTTKTVCGR